MIFFYDDCLFFNKNRGRIHKKGIENSYQCSALSSLRIPNDSISKIPISFIQMRTPVQKYLVTQSITHFVEALVAVAAAAAPLLITNSITH